MFSYLSYLILSYLILSYLILSYLFFLSYFILSYLILPYLILSYFILSIYLSIDRSIYLSIWYTQMHLYTIYIYTYIYVLGYIHSTPLSFHHVGPGPKWFCGQEGLMTWFRNASASPAEGRSQLHGMTCRKFDKPPWWHPISPGCAIARRPLFLGV